MTDEYPEKIIECIDKHFPKGDKRRGDALVLQAIAFIEGKELKLKEIVKMIEEELEHKEYIEDTDAIPLLKALISKLEGKEK